ncbi:BTAD domain-containing putative transcriptional regulator [Umezawaea sp. Da 62-37]|uniref:ATP-binding protein n=1 Tax=Umezawaea sp. Da 62-37 TaxID=3075927 RepID=UPI0028F6E354|nr:BTAD domain-containing putative transcriptional regulator [Umezawaea sp. Da 62-37]WNV86264.1 BTAD domain-containing putative transcriptional regulator [Umezawaea sp. Da 62-37]
MTTELALLSRVAYREQEITRPRVRGLLALLAGDLRSGCGTARLVAGLWPEERPENPVKALQVLVSHVRAQLGAEVVVRTPVGYRLSLAEDQVDASAVLLRAAASARHSRAGDHAAALDHAEAGLALWEGPESWDAGLADPVSALRSERASTHRALVRARALALARLGRHAEAVDALAELGAERPRDEEVLAELLRCEAATVGASTALTRYDTYRRGLRDQLGGDPGPELRAVHQQLLEGDAPVVRHRVPHEPNALLGREDDIGAVTALLRASRVTSIVGAGGLGKTRLAHAVGRRAEQRVVHLVALAGVTAEADVVAEVASVLGVGDTTTGRTGLVGGIAAALGPGPALLVLDNCEHVLDAAADLVRALVSLSGDLSVLTTSRAPLGLSSESVYPLPELSPSTAAELFGRRARAARPDVDLPDDVVREVCGHLDGLPLAVELAAARVRVMSVAEIARRLDDRFALLRGGARDAPARHRTLHAVIDWSWNLLDPGAQAAMRALSVFPGGFTADAARYLVDDDGVLERLVDQSLLKVSDTGAGTRFRMLETVREFGASRLREEGGAAAATDRFLLWARDFGVAHHESVFGIDLLPAVHRVRVEQDNLVLALRFGLEREDGPTVAATTAVLGGLWLVESNLPRAATLAEDPTWALSHFRPEPAFADVTRTAVVLCAMSGFLFLREPNPARSLVALRRLPPTGPTTLIRAVDVLFRALTDGTRDLEALCRSEDRLLAGVANAVATYAAESAGDLGGALAAARRTLTAVEGRGSPWSPMVAHARIGELCLRLDLADEARSHFMAALPMVERLGPPPTAARARWAVVLANLQCGDVDEAERWLERADLGGDDVGEVLMFGVGVRAEILLARGDVDGGLRLWRRAAERLATTANPNQRHWALEVQSVAVVAHAEQGALDLVREIADRLPTTLARMLTRFGTGPVTSFADFPLHGVLLLATAAAESDRGERADAARMIALAERFGFSRGFQPTMSAARVTAAAERADRSAYQDAVSSYADLDRAALPEAALALLRATARDRA